MVPAFASYDLLLIVTVPKEEKENSNLLLRLDCSVKRKAGGAYRDLARELSFMMFQQSVSQSPLSTVTLCVMSPVH